MQGVLIASSDPVVCAALRAILQEGRTLHERSSMVEAVTFAAAHQPDVIFVDGALRDGRSALELVEELSRLGYSHQIVPLILSTEPQFTEPFRRYGVRCFLEKPFEANRVRELVDVVAAYNAASPDARSGTDTRRISAEALAAALAGNTDAGTITNGATGSIDAREVGQRFLRLLTHVRNRDELIRYFAEALEEQLDADAVIVLLPHETRPELRIAYGDVDAEIRDQFVIPLSEPFLAAVIRAGAPVSLLDDPRIDASLSAAGRTFAERLGVSMFCPVISRGRMQALIALGRSHRYPPPLLVAVLRLFVAYFSRALEHAVQDEYLARNEAAFRTLVEYIPHPLVLVDPTGNVTAMNHAAGQLFDVEAERIVGGPVERLDSRLAGAAREIIAGGSPGPVEIRGIGTPEAFDVTPTAVPWHPSGTAALLQITARPGGSEPTETVLGSPSFWQDMGSALAHNLKNALVPIRTFADLLPERYQEEEFRESFLDVTRENIARIDQWIEQLAVFGRLDGSPVRHTRFNLHVVIDEALAKVRQEYPDLQVDVSVDSSKRDRVEGHEELLGRAFYELIKNAFEAVMECEHPRIRLRTQVFAAAVQATIVDNGPGIPEEQRERVFEPFHSGRLRGLGIGLTLARRIIELHSGQVALLPAVEAGACVEVVLPAAERPMERRH